MTSAVVELPPGTLSPILSLPALALCSFASDSNLVPMDLANLMFLALTAPLIVRVLRQPAVLSVGRFCQFVLNGKVSEVAQV